MMLSNTIFSLIRVGSLVETDIYVYFFEFLEMIKICRQGWKLLT